MVPPTKLVNNDGINTKLTISSFFIELIIINTCFSCKLNTEIGYKKNVFKIKCAEMQFVQIEV